MDVTELWRARPNERLVVRASRALGELPRRYFEDAQSIARAELDTCGAVERSYDFGGLACRIRFGGEKVLCAFERAFSHLSSDGERHDLLVGIVDESHAQNKQPKRHRLLIVSEHRVELCCDGRFTALDDPGAGSRSYVDGSAGAAWHVVDDIDDISDHERAAPLRVVLNKLFVRRQRHLVHAAAVGTRHKGVLLTGPSGTGKSSTAFSCLGSSLGYLGDSWCGIEDGENPAIFSLYSAAKLRPDAIERFPEVRGKIDRVDRSDDGKFVVFLAEHFPSSLLSRCPAAAILVPEVTGGHATTIEPLERKSAWHALVSSTLAYLPVCDRETVALLSRFAARLPAFRMGLGVDRREVCETLERFVEKL